MRLAIFFYTIILCVPVFVLGISIQIQGSFDVGPKWDFKYVASEGSNLREEDMIEKTKPWKFPEINHIRNGIEKIIQGIKDTLKIDNTYQIVTPKNIQKRKVTNKYSSYERINKSDDNRELKTIENESTYDIKRENGIIEKDSEAGKSYDIVDFVSGEDQNEISHHRETGPKIHDINTKKYKQNIFKEAKKVKDVPSVNDFLLHIYKQALKILQNMKKKVSSKNYVLRHKIKSFKKVYKHKFAYFLNRTRDNVIKTNSEAKNVIRNALITSNRILEKLVNQVKDTNHLATIKKELDRQKEIEDRHVCYELGICRSKAKFQEFLAEALQILLHSNETVLQQSFDALIEALKSTDFSKVLDSNSQDIFSDFIEQGENSRPLVIRAIYYTTLYALIHKDASISLTSIVDEDVAKRTAAFYEFIKIFDETLAKDEKDVEWQQIIQNLKQWKEGKHTDILEIMKSFVMKIIKTMEKMEKQSLDKINEVVKILFNV